MAAGSLSFSSIKNLSVATLSYTWMEIAENLSGGKIIRLKTFPPKDLFEDSQVNANQLIGKFTDKTSLFKLR